MFLKLLIGPTPVNIFEEQLSQFFVIDNKFFIIANVILTNFNTTFLHSTIV